MSQNTILPTYQLVSDGIYAIDTEYVRPLMDASHLIVDQGRAAFVDTGTTLSVPNLLATLESLDIDRADVDSVFLTHIHLDHAGGAGELMTHLPNARAYIHPRGARHMHEPEKIIAGTIAVYGERAFKEMYREIVPIEKARIVEVADGMKVTVGSRVFELIHTPGHALHHYCLVDESASLVFTGDTFGVSYRETDTGEGAFIIPTTTPVHFDPDAAHASIDHIMSYSPDSVFLTHYSRVTDTPRLARDLHADLDVYVDISQQCAQLENRTEEIRSRLSEHIYQRLDDHGYDGDINAKNGVLFPDIVLNAQGLEVWLKRLERQRGARRI